MYDLYTLCARLYNTKKMDFLVLSHFYFPFCQTDLSGAFELYQISAMSWSNHSWNKVTTSGIIKGSEER